MLATLRLIHASVESSGGTSTIDSPRRSRPRSLSHLRRQAPVRRARTRPTIARRPPRQVIAPSAPSCAARRGRRPGSTDRSCASASARCRPDGRRIAADLHDLRDLMVGGMAAGYVAVSTPGINFGIAVERLERVRRAAQDIPLYGDRRRATVRCANRAAISSSPRCTKILARGKAASSALDGRRRTIPPQ